MKLPSNLNDSELIDHIYGIAGEEIIKEITDFSDSNKWRKVVLKLDNPLKFTYLICVLDWQVHNGGFIQYYDNDYGIFCRETAIALSTIKAELASNLVLDSINILEKFKNPELDFLNYITSNQYWDNVEIETVMDKLDSEFYELDEKQNLGKLLADYLRQTKTE